MPRSIQNRTIRHVIYGLASVLVLAGCTSGASTNASNTVQPPQIAAASSLDDTHSPCYNVAAPTTPPPANAPKTFAAAPPMVIDTSHAYCAFLTTAHGTITIELYPKSAPKHVNSFVFLAGQGYYDNLTWHRVLSGFMAQTGDPLGTGTGGPGYTIPLEIDPALKYSRPGVLGMARTNDPNSAGSQFFITFGPASQLDGGYTIFGQVVRGMAIVNQISLRDQGQPPGDALISVRTVDAGVAPAR